MEDRDWVSAARTLKLDVRSFVDGRFHAGRGAEIVEKRGPRDGSVLYEFRAAHEADVDDAVGNVRRAFEDGRWSKLPLERRKAVLYRLADLIDEHTDEFALLESLDVGKPISDALAFDIPATAAKLRYAAEAADKVSSKVYRTELASLSHELRRPVGVVGAVVGWNFPLLLATTKIAPALAMGNGVVLKPSELTSLSAARLAALASEAGLPDGVLNVIHGGPRIGAALAGHRDVDLLTFTGSSQTGKKVMAAAGESNMKRLLLECGGKSPNIVFDDAPDLNAVAEAVVRGAFWNQGQVCTASSRLLVHESIRETFLPLLIQKTRALGIGDPLNAATKFGAVVSRGHQQKILSCIQSAVTEGANIVYYSEATAPLPGGFYVPPVVFDGVLPGHKVAQEEIFGPVLSVISFRGEREAVGIANDTIYGLSAILWTKDIGRAHRVTHGLRAGWIVVNATATPNGGAGGALALEGHKQSGIGTEGGMEGLTTYTTRSFVQTFV